MKALEWVAANHKKPAVINLSVRSTTDNTALSRALSSLAGEHQLPTIVAAGNDGTDACSSLTSNITGVIAVGATTQNDNIWPSSNWCVNAMLWIRTSPHERLMKTLIILAGGSAWLCMRLGQTLLGRAASPIQTLSLGMALPFRHR